MSNEYKVGDIVAYRGDPNNLWKVSSIEDGIKHRWTMAEKLKTGISRVFPYEIFNPVDIEVKPTTPIQEKTKKQPIPKPDMDDVGKLLLETKSIDECWAILTLADPIAVETIKIKINHLSNGLQKMNIGNHLRKMVKNGEFDPNDIIWDVERGFIKVK